MFESVRILLDWTNLRKRSKQSRSTQTTRIACKLIHELNDSNLNPARRVSSTESRSSGSEVSFVSEGLTLHLSSLHKSEHFCGWSLPKSTLRRLLSITPTCESSLYESESRRTRLFQNEIEYALHKFVCSLASCFRASCVVDPKLRNVLLEK